MSGYRLSWVVICKIIHYLGPSMLNENVTPQSTLAATLPPPRKIKIIPLVIIISALITIFAFGAYYLINIGDNPTSVAKGFINNLTDNDLKSAYEMTSSQFQTTVTVADLEKFLTQYPILKNIDSVKFPFKNVTADVAKISGELNSKDGKNSPITMVVVKENGNWKVLNLSLNPQDVPREVANEQKK